MWQDPTVAPAGPRTRLEAAATAALPYAVDWGGRLYGAGMADTIVTGIPNLAIGAAAVWAWAKFRPRRRRRRRDYGDD